MFVPRIGSNMPPPVTVAEDLERAAALVEMRGAGDDLLRFRSASRREAFAAAQIRRCRQGGAK